MNEVDPLRELPRRVSTFMHKHASPAPDGRYYATPDLAKKLQDFLETEGFVVAVGVENGQFDIQARKA